MNPPLMTMNPPPVTMNPPLVTMNPPPVTVNPPSIGAADAPKPARQKFAKKSAEVSYPNYVKTHFFAGL
jgi:hypothetical protein